MKIFFSAGEPSGDHHAAKLIRVLRSRCPEAEFVGFGGPEMEAAGCRLLFPLTRLAIMWFVRVLANLHRFLALVSQADRHFRHHRPDAVVLVDFPGFNWWIARRAHAHGIPVFYYVPPQIWGWLTGRVRKMRRWVDHVLCSLPFEPKWYAERGVHAVYVGHPYFDESEESASSETTSQTGVNSSNARSTSTASSPSQDGRPVIGILPGSRTQEVVKNLPDMLRAAALVSERLPHVRFRVACFREAHRRLAAEMARSRHGGDGRSGVSSAAGGERPLDLELCVGRTQEIIRRADACLAVSGSVSLELLAATTPTVVLYRIERVSLIVGNFMKRVPYICLVNLLAEDELFPEYLTDRDESAAMADHLLGWLTRPDDAARLRARLAALKDEVCAPGAASRAAAYILEHVQSRSPRRRRGKRLQADAAHPSPQPPHASAGTRRRARVQ